MITKALYRFNRNRERVVDAYFIEGLIRNDMLDKKFRCTKCREELELSTTPSMDVPFFRHKKGRCTKDSPKKVDGE